MVEDFSEMRGDGGRVVSRTHDSSVGAAPSAPTRNTSTGKRTLRVRVDAGLRLAAGDVPPKVLEALCRALSLPNPAYWKLVRLRKRPGAEPQTLYFFRQEGRELVLPRGAIHLLRRAADGAGLTLSFEDARVLPPKRLPKLPEVALRDYQAEAVERLAKATQGTAVLPCGGGKCVKNDSLIFTDRGLVTAAELAVGVPEEHAAFTEVGVDTSTGRATTNAVYNGGRSPTKRARLALGYELEATPEHPIRVLRDDALAWVRMDELHVGDRVALRRGSEVWGRSSLPEAFRWVKPKYAANLKLPKGLVLDEVAAEACGLLVSEGTLTKRLVTEFTNADADNVGFISRWAASIGIDLSRNGSDSIQYLLCSVVLREWLAWLGLDYTRAAGKCIPRAVRFGGRDIMRAFLRGLFDGDASVDPLKGVIEFCTASERMAREVQVALLGLGILASRHSRTVAGYEQLYWRVTVNDVATFEREVGFSSNWNRLRLREAVARAEGRCRNPNVDTVPINGLVERLYRTAQKQLSWSSQEGRIFGNYVHGEHAPSRAALERMVQRWGSECPTECLPIEAFLELPVAFLSVESIEDGEADVVDLSVPETHEFVANGVVCHNTMLALGAVARLRTQTLVLVHTLDLAEQWREHVRERLGLEAGLVGAGEEDVQPVTVAVVQSLTRWEDAKLDAFLGRFGLLVLDEAHHIGASAFHRIVDRCPARYRLGLTATPEREDGLTPLLRLYLGAPLAVVRHEELVARGVLVVPEVRVVETAFEYPYVGSADYAPMLGALVEDKARNDLVLGAVAREAWAGHLCLVLTGRVDHCELLAQRLSATGIPAAALTSAVPRAERKALLDKARAGRVRVLVATSLADEGLDLPRLSRVFVVYPGCAKGRTVQRLGRLMRPHEDKKSAVLIDFLDRKVPLLRRHHVKRRQQYAAVLGVAAAASAH
ncbi:MULTISPECIES: DEAD/DEAH box helicase family protein [Myxococcus]|uniref:DEAD/DEAH box helicase family protein n=1 Tax=Myxococcus TaxID=32 RepID=UPI000303D497|nr:MULTISPECIES: DEAD/DEAH box helicase family protein [Myxococcus]NOJ57779.1 DEAD/DEAH box helicase family protein [Myxococcus xanthus]QPM81470.1 DEAD/DEAH box helicase family protein [Myxococcus xanthus]QVW70720.1 DEAD/DEAH box helicase family protein [Myxococcus xanthus DZ2]QZZ49628.1 ATP-dependent RNA helicase RhlB [Myxococcus xanthus]UEO03153.1 DEAD/DEAH box helicase family protein [Myxococcus xanthus DZ2]